MNTVRRLVSVHNSHPKTRLKRAAIESSVEAVLKGERLDAEIRVILVSDEHLLEMNRQFLQHDYYTDVITFPIEKEPLAVPATITTGSIAALM